MRSSDRSVTITITILITACRLTLAPDRHFLHLLPEPVTASCHRGCFLAARQALSDSQDTVDNDGVDALLDLSLQVETY